MKSASNECQVWKRKQKQSFLLRHLYAMSISDGFFSLDTLSFEFWEFVLQTEVGSSNYVFPCSRAPPPHHDISETVLHHWGKMHKMPCYSWRQCYVDNVFYLSPPLSLSLCSSIQKHNPPFFQLCQLAHSYIYIYKQRCLATETDPQTTAPLRRASTPSTARLEM